MPAIPRIFRIALMALVGLSSAAALADPPSHAPAHGWRAKHDPYYVGYSGKQWEHDYSILSGHCDHHAIATVLGSMVGAAVGAHVADDEDRTVAMIIGAAAGALIGHKIGESMDDGDRGCIGHSLEVAKTGQHVLWVNDKTGVNYDMLVGGDRDRDGSKCREFTLIAKAGDRKSSKDGVGCESKPGVWDIARLKS
jgi:surface antigen